MTHLKRVLLACLVSTLLASTALTAGQGRGRGNTSGHGGQKAVTASDQDDGVAIDREGHRRVVREYYTQQALPPGLAKREALPPGLEKQLRERGELPPGLQKRMTRVPAPLAARLPGLPSHYSRYFAGTDLIIVDDRTNRIAAVVPNIF
jgi:hypothetical protein